MSQPLLQPLKAASVSDNPGSEGGTSGFVEPLESERRVEEDEEEEEIFPS